MGRGGQSGVGRSAQARRERYFADQKRRLEQFKRDVRTFSNQQLITEAEDHILGAAILESRGRDDGGYEDGCAMACLDEAIRRGNSDLYQRAYNEIARRQGHSQMIKEVKTPIEVGDLAMAVEISGDGLFHLLDKDAERPSALCGRAVPDDALHRRRDEINIHLTCADCAQREEERFEKLREENGLTERHEMASAASS